MSVSVNPPKTPVTAGSNGVAAATLGLSYVGIELDPEYAPKRKPQPSLPSTRVEPEYDPLDALGHDDLPDAASEASDEPVVVYDNAPTTRVYVGMRVRHSKWGVGSVIGWSGRGEQMKLELRFPSGSRTIMARFCEVIG